MSQTSSSSGGAAGFQQPAAEPFVPRIPAPGARRWRRATARFAEHAALSGAVAWILLYSLNPTFVRAVPDASVPFYAISDAQPDAMRCLVAAAIFGALFAAAASMYRLVAVPSVRWAGGG